MSRSSIRRRGLALAAVAAVTTGVVVTQFSGSSSVAEVRSNAIRFSLTATSARPATTISAANCAGNVVLGEYQKIRGMAESWRTSTTESVKADFARRIDTGLRALRATCWSATRPVGNWYNNEIAIPEEIAHTALLVTGSGIDMNPYINDSLFYVTSRIDGYHTGANVVGVGLNLVLLGAVRGDATMLTQGRSAMLRGLQESRWEGFTPDQGYSYHNALYTAGYGNVVARRFGTALNVFGSTTWQFTSEQRSFLFARLLDGFRPTTVGRVFMELSRGRQVTVQYGDAPASGIAVALNWMRPWAGNRTAEVDNWIAQLSGRASTRPELFKMYYNNEKAVWHNGEVAVGVSMHSQRRRAFELLGGNNLEGWYLSEGMIELHDTDTNQFLDYWLATIDRQRLPGTTVSRKPLTQLPCNTLTNSVAWVGGAELGTVGAVGQQLDPNLKTAPRSENPQCPVASVDLAVDLLAKKSWFLFDDEIVALGSDIRSADPIHGVETVVENRKVTGPDVITINGSAVSPTLGSTQRRDDVRWAHLAGDAGSLIGYVFPTATTVDIKRETRTGAWSQIDRSTFSPVPSKTTPATRKYVSLSLDHGITPNGASYAYILLPASSAAETATYAETPDARVLINTAAVQAATDASTGVTAANFWFAGTAGPITVDAAASVVTRITDGRLSVAVSDPTQLRTTPLRLTFAPTGTITGTVSRDPNITVVATSPQLVLDIAPATNRGSTSTAVFDITVAPPAQVATEGPFTHASTRAAVLPVTTPGVLANDAEVTATLRLDAKPSTQPVAVQFCVSGTTTFARQACSPLTTVAMTGTVDLGLGRMSSWWVTPGVAIGDVQRTLVKVVFKDPATGRHLLSTGCGTFCYQGTDLGQRTPISGGVTLRATSPST